MLGMNAVKKKLMLFYLNGYWTQWSGCFSARLGCTLIIFSDQFNKTKIKATKPQ